MVVPRHYLFIVRAGTGPFLTCKSAELGFSSADDSSHGDQPADTTRRCIELVNMSVSEDIIDSYDSNAPLEEALTIPASWYTDQNLYNLELQTVFSNSWHFAGRVDQVSEPGNTSPAT